MTKLEKIVEFAKSLTAEQQDSLADDLVALMRKRTPSLRLSAREIADVQAALAQKNPDFANDAEVQAALGERLS